MIVEGADSNQEETSTVVQEKCTKQRAQIAKRNAKFLSSHRKTNQFIAEIAFKTIKSFN
jgi:hypothetical protein